MSQFLRGYGLNIHLFLQTDIKDPTRLFAFGSNTDSLCTRKFKNWLEIFTDKYSQIYYSHNHFYQVYPYTPEFLREQFIEATNDMLKNIADFVSCEVFWSLYVPEGVGDIGANSNKQYAEDLTA